MQSNLLVDAAPNRDGERWRSPRLRLGLTAWATLMALAWIAAGCSEESDSEQDSADRGRFEAPSRIERRGMAGARGDARDRLARPDGDSETESGSDRGFTLPGGLSYTNERIARGPWSIHVVRVPRTGSRYTLQSTHANGRAIGLAPLTQLIGMTRPGTGRPVAAVNGDFYQRDRTFAGDPRGTQVIDGEVISAPNGRPTLWIGADGTPGIGEVESKWRVVWPDGSQTPFGMNEDRRANTAVLYTPAVGSSTRAGRGREFILEPVDATRWLPWRLGETYQARVREVRDAGNSPVAPGTVVLSLGPTVAGRVPSVEPGAVLTLSTVTEPELKEVVTAIGGGPLLVRQGKAIRNRDTDSDDYRFSSMTERHPRSAVGWSRDAYFLVQVDGRQWGLSVGMTLDELANYLVRLGCQEAMNLDGGGSATLWCHGRIRNSPCDGWERPIANALVVVEAPPAGP